MSRPMNDEPTIRGGKVAVPTYLEYEVAVLLRDYVKSHKPITASDLLTQMVCALYNLKTTYEVEVGNLRTAANSIIEKNSAEFSRQVEEHQQAAIGKVSSIKAESDRKAAEKEEADKKAAEAEQKYREKVWRALRREVIGYYDIINRQLKEIEAKKARGDEDDYEAPIYPEIRANLEYRKILRSQKDLSYQTFIDCFNSVDYTEEVEKPRKTAEAEMEAAEA